MAYCDQGDIEDKFGVDNVKKWSNLTGSATTTDTDRVARAIDYATAYLDDVFGTFPQARPAAAMLTDLAARLAGVWLYDSRAVRDGDAAGTANRMAEHQEHVDSVLEAKCIATAQSGRGTGLQAIAEAQWYWKARRGSRGR